MNKKFKLFGFTIPLNKFLIFVASYLAIIVVLVIVDLFWFSISWYGVLMGTAFVLAVIIATDLCQYRNLNKDFPYDLIWWIFPLSILGARLYYVIMEAGKSINSFMDAIAIWNGGLAIYGGIIGGTLGLIICCLIKKKDILSTTDVIVPVLILGQAIGRWGNFINQEVYGFVVNNPAAQWFPLAVKVGSQWHLALFFYESVLNLIGFFVLVIMLRKIKQKGIVSATYLIYYGTVRLCLESFRMPDYILYLGNSNVPVSSVVSGIIIVIGVAMLATILIKNKKSKSASSSTMQSRKKSGK